MLLSLRVIPVESNSAGIMPSAERACATRTEGATTSNYAEPQYKNPAARAHECCKPTQQPTVGGHFGHTLGSTRDLLPSGWTYGAFCSKWQRNYLLIAGALSPEESLEPRNPQLSLALKPFLQLRSTQRHLGSSSRERPQPGQKRVPLVHVQNTGLARS
ncbi:hypothetical protein SRHO_G00305110 [Serrasalmus rhombeus]